MIVKKGLNKLIIKNSIPNTLIGSLIGAAATIHPAGLVVGGIAGVLQGKSKRYEEAQGKLHEMEKEILSTQDYDITPEEIRLAKYSGYDLSEFVALAFENDQITDKNLSKTAASHTSPIVRCYDLEQKSGETDFQSRRTLASRCFYHTN